ncbi:RHS repeat domain-containing protein [Acinetobacter courvalinii]|uniref:RHS repeat domain-containing protein n=1 Tax=Acinetobacter courvalinii TaxID=280147 RepID=UPI003F55B4B6
MYHIFYFRNYLNFLFGFILLNLSIPSNAAFLEDVTASPKQITSCISDSGINPIANQVEFKKIDITGPLPFIRSYSTTVHLTSKDYNEAYYSPMDNEIREMGVGWTHNYAYKLEDGVAAHFNGVKIALRLYLPEIGKFITFVRDNDKYLRSSGAPHWGVVKDVETTLTQTSQGIFVANHKGIEIFFEYKSNNKSFIATKVIYPGGKVIHFDYAYSSQDQRWLLKKVSDNLNNALVLNHYENNWDLRGAISSVQTLNNHKQQQIANYTYDVRDITWPMPFFVFPGKPDNVYDFKKLPNLVSVNSTINPREDYIYSDYSRRTMFKSNVRFPVMTEYKENNLTKRIWSYSNTSISSFVPGFANEVRVEKPNNDTLSIYRQLSPIIRKTDTYTNNLNLRNSDVGYVPETVYGNDERFSRFQANGDASCLTYNNVPINNFVVANGLRQMVSIADKNNNRTDFKYDSNGRLLELIEAKGSPLQRISSLTYDTRFWIPSTIKRGNLSQKNTINDIGQVIESIQSSDQAESIDKRTSFIYSPAGLLLSTDGPRAGEIDKINYSYDNYGNLTSQAQMINGAVRTTQYLNYHSSNKPERVVQPTGLVDQFVYNADGTLASQTISMGEATPGQTTTYAYNTFKQKIRETNPDGESTQFAYDPMGRLIQTIFPNGSINTKRYFENSVIYKDEYRSKDGTNIFKSTTQYIDNNGRVSQIWNGIFDGWYSVDYRYDANGNLLETQSRLGVINKWRYDALNREIQFIDGNGDVHTRDYDLNDNAISIKDPLSAGSAPLHYRNGGY